MSLSGGRKIGFYVFLLGCLGGAGYFFLRSPYGPFPWLREPSSNKLIGPELAKILQVMDHYKTANIEVIYDGKTLTAAEMFQRAKQYVLSHYEKGRTAEEFVSEYCYRSEKGEIIYFKYADGTTRLMRDVFLEDLKGR